jgi:peptidoglycan/LPS O-acetylase OafA/YrhL
MRLKTIDGLRGIAALAVVFYHLNLAARLSYGRWTPEWLDWLLQQGFLGVDVFFVISGFVIAYSVRLGTFTLDFLGCFVVRRFIRLDPPYWVAIFLEIGLIWLSLRVGSSNASLPSTAQLAAHFFYLQNILELGDIVPIFWTLCYEVQFYVFLIALLVAGRVLLLRVGARRLHWISVFAFGILFVVSVFARYDLFSLRIHPGFAINRWFQFFLGTVVWWVVSKRITAHYLFAAWGFLAGAVLVSGQSLLQVLPIGISGLLWWSYKRDRMVSILSGRIWQFLGAISYSLYLFHSSIGWRLVRAPDLLLGVAPVPTVILGIYLTSILACILCAWAAWRIFERPFMELSKAVSLPKRDDFPAQVELERNCS